MFSRWEKERKKESQAARQPARLPAADPWPYLVPLLALTVVCVCVCVSLSDLPYLHLRSLSQWLRDTRDNVGFPACLSLCGREFKAEEEWASNGDVGHY